MKTITNRREIIRLLAGHIPEAGPTLNYGSTFQLLIAVMLSAQCTDQRVNMTTTGLFARYAAPEDFAALDPRELAEEIKGCGLYRNKSRHIVETSRILVNKFGGRVPDNLADLESLPGVGRKTANVVLSVAFGKPAMPVDTHIFRVARRLGLSGGRTPRQVEDDLTMLLPPEELHVWHHRLIHFGRNTCRARKPLCRDCPLNRHCPWIWGFTEDNGGR